MALAEIPGWPITYPSLLGDSNTGTFASQTMDADVEKVQITFVAPADGTINRCGFLLGAVTQNPTNGLRTSFQGQDAAGDPDDTETHFRVVPTGDISANAWVTTGLITDDGTDTGAKLTVTQGQFVSFVIEFESFVASDSLAIRTRLLGPWGDTFQRIPYSALFTTAWGTRLTANIPFAVQYDDNTWRSMFGASPIASALNTNYNASSTPDECGMKFICPAAIRAVGFILHSAWGGATETLELHLYDSSGAELASATPSPVEVASTAAGIHVVRFDNIADSVTLEAGETYRITQEATGAGNVARTGIVLPGGDYSMASAGPWGEDAVFTSRSDGSSTWTDATDGTVMAIGLLIDAMDDGASSGSSGGSTTIIRRFYED
jgi:hypothetical protein